MKAWLGAILSLPLLAYGQLICLGDSQTAVRPPVQSADTYCNKMASAIGTTAINKGVGGNTSADALARMDDVLAQPGSCVTVMLGTNDAWIDPSLQYDYSSF